MSRFLIKLFGFLLGFALLLSLLIFVIPKSKSPSYYLYNYKMSLVDTVSAPRLIFVSGSSLCTSLDSKRIEDSLHVHVINSGLHAGIGLKYTIDDVVPRVKSGDVVVIGAEYPQFYTDAYGNKTLAVILYYNGWKNLSSLNLKQWLNVIKGIPYIIRVNIIEGLLFHEFVGKVTNPMDAINKNGDEILHWKIDADGTGIVSGASKEDLPLDTFFCKYFVKKLQEMEAKGARVVMIPSVIRETAFKYEQKRAYEIDSFFRKYGYGYNSKPENHVMPDSCAWNTDYHMNYKGVQRNTEVLIDEFKPLFLTSH